MAKPKRPQQAAAERDAALATLGVTESETLTVPPDPSLGSFGIMPVVPKADTLPPTLATLAVPAGAAAEPEPIASGDLVLEVVTTSDDIGRRVERLTEVQVDALAPRIKLQSSGKTFPRSMIEGVVRYSQGYLVQTEARPYYVKGR